MPNAFYHIKTLMPSNYIYTSKNLEKFKCLTERIVYWNNTQGSVFKNRFSDLEKYSWYAHLKKVGYRAEYATYVQSVDFISTQAHTNRAYLKSSGIIVEFYFPFHASVHFSNSFHLFVLLF